LGLFDHVESSAGKAGLEFRIDSAGFSVGQIQRVVQDKGELLRLLNELQLAHFNSRTSF